MGLLEVSRACRDIQDTLLHRQCHICSQVYHVDGKDVVWILFNPDTLLLNMYEW